MKDYVGRDDFGLKFGMLSFVARILAAAHVPPRPTVESTFLNASDVVGNEIIAKSIAFVDGAPEVADFGLHREANTVADPVGENAHGGAVGIEFENVRAIFF